MIKLPEPVTTVKSLLGEYASCKFTNFSIRKGDKLYTEAQLKQAVRDALGEAVGLCDDDNTANAIRALIKEIE